jgi:hypothetical protein
MFRKIRLFPRVCALISAILFLVPTGIARAEAISGGEVGEYYKDAESGEWLAGNVRSVGSVREGRTIGDYTLAGYREDIDHYYSKTEPQQGDTHSAYINVYADGSIRPDAPITRAETASALYQLTGAPAVSGGAAFTDIDNSAWYANAVSYLQSSGIISGYEDGTFKPEAPITRAEFAAIAARHAGLEISSPGSTVFTDVPASRWYCAVVTRAADEGWITGYNGGEFRPDGEIKRAEAVTMLNRMAGRYATAENLPDGAPTFPDLPESHWAYANIIEASVTHGGAPAEPYAKVTEKFVDTNGTEIAPPVETAGTRSAPDRNFDGYHYLGSETIIVYTYIPDGASGYHGGWGWLYTDVQHNTVTNLIAPTGWVVPGDTVTYTLRVDNDTDDVDWVFDGIGGFDVTAEIENAVATVILPSRVVYEDVLSETGMRTDYDAAAHKLTVYPGDIPIGGSVSMKVITTVTKEEGVYSETLSAAADIVSDNYWSRGAWPNQTFFGVSYPYESPDGYVNQIAGNLTVFDLDYPDGEKRP